MKQITDIQKTKNQIKQHHKDIEKLEDKIDKLKESSKYKIVNCGIGAKGNLGSITLCPEFENPRRLNIKLSDDCNRFHGTTIRYDSVRRLRDYLNDFLKTRPSSKK